MRIKEIFFTAAWLAVCAAIIFAACHGLLYLAQKIDWNREPTTKPIGLPTMDYLLAIKIGAISGASKENLEKFASICNNDKYCQGVLVLDDGSQK